MKPVFTDVRTISLLVALVIVVTLVLGVVADRSDAQEQVSCPDGTTLSADGTTCLSDAVDDNVTTTTSCLQGVLSEDGKFCIVPRLDAPTPAPAGSGAPIEAPVPTFTG